MAETRRDEPISNPNPLSEREMDVARLLAEGLSNGEIAHRLVLSPHTVKVHLRNIYGKLEVSSRTEATMSLVQQGWLVVEGVELAEPAPIPVAPALPEPAPLAPFAPAIAPWQRIYLVAAVLISVLALGLPTLLASTAAQPLDLLSDRDRLTLGRPTLESLPRWEVRTPLPQARSRLVMVLVGNQLYAMGGETAQGETVGTVDLYNLTVNEWSQGADLPVAVANSAAVVLDGRIFLAGGSTAIQSADAGATRVVRDELWVFDAQAETWGVAGVLPVPLAGANLVALDGALYLVGGWDGTALHDEVWRWTPGADSAKAEDWEVVARMASPRAFMGSVGLNGLIYVVGGYDGAEELAAAMTLDVSSGEWAALPDLSVPRAGHALVYDGGAVVALGGGLTQAILTHERLDPVIGLWSNFQSPLDGEWRHLAAAVKDGNIHLIGGWSGDYLDLHMQYQSRFINFLPMNIQGK
ncbi:MAG: hypothetical protein KBG20_05360 [Caldilineaceae bacterium]|nr:hypothetical protein [Caldilineaceae bacterium]MBP8106653.1 hypothetical protein [Caldilineaceae bacterium]MBP8122207.1 hypothetical protein [Caldilineaceae bacterium]MBP9071704.1 hypothetical protein [Caldilineaceae bacterium]